MLLGEHHMPQGSDEDKHRAVIITPTPKQFTGNIQGG